MHWMLLLLLAFASVVGSWLWLRPSPAERRSARLRARAPALGLEVRLGATVRPPLHGVEPQDAVYMLAMRRGGLVSRCVHMPLQGDGIDEDLRLAAAMLPPGVSLVGVHAGHAVAVWDEAGGEPQLEQLRASLLQLAGSA